MHPKGIEGLRNTLFYSEEYDRKIPITYKDQNRKFVIVTTSKELANGQKVIFEEFVLDGLNSILNKLAIELNTHIDNLDSKKYQQLLTAVYGISQKWHSFTECTFFTSIGKQLNKFILHFVQKVKNGFLNSSIKKEITEAIRFFNSSTLEERGIMNLDYIGPDGFLLRLMDTDLYKGRRFLNLKYYKINSEEYYKDLFIKPFYISSPSTKTFNFECNNQVSCYILSQISPFFGNLSEEAIINSQRFLTKNGSHIKDVSTFNEYVDRFASHLKQGKKWKKGLTKGRKPKNFEFYLSVEEAISNLIESFRES